MGAMAMREFYARFADQRADIALIKAAHQRAEIMQRECLPDACRRKQPVEPKPIPVRRIGINGFIMQRLVQGSANIFDRVALAFQLFAGHPMQLFSGRIPKIHRPVLMRTN